MGMMNNSIYRIRPYIASDEAEKTKGESDLFLSFRHPTEPGSAEGMCPTISEVDSGHGI